MGTNPGFHSGRMGPRENVTMGRLGGSHSLVAPPKRARWKRGKRAKTPSLCNSEGIALLGGGRNVDTFHYGS